MPYSGTPKEVAAKKKAYTERNKIKLLAYQKQYRIDNAEILSAKTIQWQKDNPEKYAAKNIGWDKKNKARSKSIKMKYDYGITLEDYNRMFEEQKGRCKICGVHQSETKRPLHIDHCHNNLHVRGLLCQHCNSGIGFFKDNIEIMQNAIKYLTGQI